MILLTDTDEWAESSAYSKVAFTHLFGPDTTNSGVFARLVQFVWACVKAVSRTLGRTKQPGRYGLKRRELRCGLLLL